MDDPAAPPPSAPLVRRPHFIAGSALVVLLIVVGALVFVTPRRPPLPCDASTLQIGDTKLLIQTLAHTSGSSINVPSGKPNVALWVQGTNAHYVFALSPTGKNLSLNEKFSVGDPIRISWGDCSADEYVVSARAADVPGEAALLDQSQGGITIFVPKTSASSGWLLEGKRAELLTPQAALPTDANAVQAEVSFLEQSISADGKTLVLKIEIKNAGAKVIHLAQDEMSLASGDGAPMQPLSVVPALPADIQPGQSQALTITFPRPASNVATFKLLDFSVDLYF